MKWEEDGEGTPVSRETSVSPSPALSLTLTPRLLFCRPRVESLTGHRKKGTLQCCLKAHCASPSLRFPGHESVCSRVTHWRRGPVVPSNTTSFIRPGSFLCVCVCCVSRTVLICESAACIIFEPPTFRKTNALQSTSRGSSHSKTPVVTNIKGIAQFMFLLYELRISFT